MSSSTRRKPRPDSRPERTGAGNIRLFTKEGESQARVPFQLNMLGARRPDNLSASLPTRTGSIAGRTV